MNYYINTVLYRQGYNKYCLLSFRGFLSSGGSECQDYARLKNEGM
jgi:hypothetical protein